MLRRINFERELDANQLAAVKSSKRFIRVTAGAGSGKTTALTYRFAYLVQELHIDPRQILCVTFTRKATAEMKQRIDQLLGINSNTVMTFNALGYKILSAEKERLGWQADCNVIDEQTGFIEIAKEILESLPSCNHMPVSVADLTDYISARKMEIDYLPYLNPDDSTLTEKINSDEEERSKQEEFFYAYLDYQRKYAMVDFTDQVRIPLLLFKHYPEVQEKWSRKFRYILVDEFQDVSDLNYRLCEALAGSDNSLFVVGDPDQVIYTWRDAVPDYLINFDRTHELTDSINMMTNYRSTKEIVAGANHVIRNNVATHDKHLQMIPGNTEEAEKICYYHAKSAEDEAMKVAGLIQSLMAQGIEGNRIAILFRTHNSAFEIRHKLRRMGIPYTEIDDERAPKVLPVIQDIIASFRFIIDPSDKNFDELPRDYFKALTDMEPDQPATDGSSKYEQIKTAAEQNPKEYQQAIKLIHLIEDVRGRCDDTRIGARNLVKVILDQCGITDYLINTPIEDERSSWLELCEEAFSLEQQLAFREFVSLIDDKTTFKPEKDNNAVRLMTIHAAKGLEFDYVFVIHMIDHIMPIHNKARTTLRELEEERRIAYVAFTRARKKLWISDYTETKKKSDNEANEQQDDGEESNAQDANGEAQPSHYIVELGIGAGLIDQLSEPLLPADIKEIDDLYQRTQYIAAKKTKKQLEHFTLLTDVEHVLYGHGTVRRTEPGGALSVDFERFDEPLTITDTSKLIVAARAEDDFIPNDNEFTDCSIKEDDPPATRQFKMVQNLINDTYHDREHENQISVLPLPCGTGKSSAISRLICQTIAEYKAGSKKGLLILANNNYQLNEYLITNEKSTRQYIKHHLDYIVRMDSDNKDDVAKLIPDRPVLIISTQRYFGFDPYLLESEYLTFGKEKDCFRDLIIVDEEPNVYECCVYNRKNLDLMDKAIRIVFESDTVPDEEKQEKSADQPEALWDENGTVLCKKTQFCLGYWELMKHYIEQKLDELKSKAGANENYYAYLPSGRIYSELGMEMLTVAHSFERALYNHRNQFYFVLDKFENDENFNVFLGLRGLKDFIRKGAIYEHATFGANERSQFSVRVSNDLYFDADNIGAKIIIMDGTADISPTYKYDRRLVMGGDIYSFEPGEYFVNNRFHLVDCSAYARNLEKLTIKIYNRATSSTSQQIDQNFRNKLLNYVDDIVSQEIPSNTKWGLFVNKQNRRAYSERFPLAAIEHFGNIRGKNKFNKYRHIVQSGMFRFPDSYYFIYEMDADVGLNLDVDYTMRNEDNSQLIKERITSKSGITADVRNRLLLCDIEQNFYRGCIRNFESEPYTFILFCSTKEYKDLIDMMKDRYHGASIIVYGDSPDEVSSKELFWNWYNALPVGTRYIDADIRMAVKTKAIRLRDWYKDYKDIQRVLENDRVPGKRMVYVKKA